MRLPGYFKRRSTYSVFQICEVFLYYLQVENLDKAMQILAAHPNNQRGQKHVADMLDVEPGIQDDTRLFLEDIFYLE